MHATLAQLVGAAAVFSDPERCQEASRSWFSPALKAPQRLVDVVVEPATTAEVAAVLAWANAEGHTVRAVGGGTGLQPVAPATIGLDLRRLQEITWDERAMQVRVGAGVVLGALEEQLRAHGLTLGQELGSATIATIGGSLATDASGLLAGKYGRMGERAVALTVALASGEVITLGAPDLSLFVGSRGTLGIITEATLKLTIAPTAQALCGFTFPDRTTGLEATRLLCRGGVVPALALLEANRLLLVFEGEELLETGPYQLAFAVCQNVGGSPLSAEATDQWWQEHSQARPWATDVEDTYTDRLTVWASWSSVEETGTALEGALAGAGELRTSQLYHPTVTGAMLTLAWMVRGDLRRFAELRTTLQHAAASTGALPGAQPSALWPTLKRQLDPNIILPTYPT